MVYGSELRMTSYSMGHANLLVVEDLEAMRRVLQWQLVRDHLPAAIQTGSAVQRLYDCLPPACARYFICTKTLTISGVSLPSSTCFSSSFQ